MKKIKAKEKSKKLNKNKRLKTMNQKEKEKDLVVERREYGYVQKYNYCNMDLLHEEVLDLDSPFATLASAETLVLTYLLIGDQNAGKSSKNTTNRPSFKHLC